MSHNDLRSFSLDHHRTRLHPSLSPLLVPDANTIPDRDPDLDSDSDTDRDRESDQSPPLLLLPPQHHESQHERLSSNNTKEQKGIKRSNARTVLLVVTWILLSNGVILYNKYVLDTRGFRYPITLTSGHLLFATLATQLLARVAPHLLQASPPSSASPPQTRKFRMTGRVYVRAIVPIGVLYAASLVCSNYPYLTLSVAFIQILKSLGPAAVLLSSTTLGLVRPTVPLVVNVVVIVGGVTIASLGEISFVLSGFLWQMGGLAFEAYRLALIERLLSSGRESRDGNKEEQEGEKEKEEDADMMMESAPPSVPKMNPLLTLYYYAPVCFALTFLAALASEMPHSNEEQQQQPQQQASSSFSSSTTQTTSLRAVGPLLLLGNAAAAFALNVVSVLLIDATSSLTLTLCGVLKNALLVGVSVAIWGTVVSATQVLGYAVATVGLVYYSLGKEVVHGWIRKVALGVVNRTSSAVGVSRQQRRRNVPRRKGLVAFVGAAAVLGALMGAWTGYSQDWEAVAMQAQEAVAKVKAGDVQTGLRQYWYSAKRLGGWVD